MAYRIRGLDPVPFAPLFHLSDAELRQRGAVRRFAQPGSIYPCRVSLKDASLGEEVILTNFPHVAASASPYRGNGPIFVRRAADEVWDRVDEVPAMMLERHWGVRGYDGEDMIVAAQVARGSDLLAAASELFARDDTAYVHVHHAAYGCYMCRIDRV